MTALIIICLVLAGIIAAAISEAKKEETVLIIYNLDDESPIGNQEIIPYDEEYETLFARNTFKYWRAHPTDVDWVNA